MTSAFADPPDTSIITIRCAGRTIVVRPAPRREPPYDDEQTGPLVPIGPHDRPLPFDRPRARFVEPVAPNPLRAALPDPAHWGRRLLVGVTEAAAGRRALNQLTALLTPSVAHGLRAEFERAAHRGRPHWTGSAQVRSVRATEPADQVAELCATMRVGQRVRAIALRLEARHGRWCCTRLMFG